MKEKLVVMMLLLIVFFVGAIQSQATILTERQKTATVGKGEGVEHAFIRQLIKDPADFGFEGNGSDAMAVKKWAQKEAHKIAIRAGYFDWKFGGEIRVKQAYKIAYVLKKDNAGKLSVNEFVKSDSGFQNFAQQIQKVADSFMQAQFIAHVSPDGNGTVSAPHLYFQLPITQL